MQYNLPPHPPQHPDYEGVRQATTGLPGLPYNASASQIAAAGEGAVSDYQILRALRLAGIDITRPLQPNDNIGHPRPLPHPDRVKPVQPYQRHPVIPVKGRVQALINYTGNRLNHPAAAPIAALEHVSLAEWSRGERSSEGVIARTARIMRGTGGVALLFAIRYSPGLAIAFAKERAGRAAQYFRKQPMAPAPPQQPTGRPRSRPRPAPRRRP